MKAKHYLVLSTLFVLVLTLFAACKKDKETSEAPVVQLTVEGTVLNIKVNEMIVFSALNVNGKAYEQEWKLDGEIQGNGSDYEFSPIQSGIYTVAYRARNSGGEFVWNYTVNVGLPNIPVTPGSSAYVKKVFEYLPGPGQFINRTSGTLTAAKSLEGKSGLVSLGAWGGYIILGFDHTVINESGKDDLIVFGNPLADFAEPGIVWVMKDANGNGLPDDTWYEIKGSEYNQPGYVRDYEVTYTKPAAGGGPVAWRDNKGNSGTVNMGTKVQGYPSWITGNEYTLKGSLLPSANIKPGNRITSMPFAFGYADNLADGDKIDIANAVDATGKPVALAGIDFIKIQTGVQANMGILGEFSTELLGVLDLGMVK